MAKLPPEVVRSLDLSLAAAPDAPPVELADVVRVAQHETRLEILSVFHRMGVDLESKAPALVARDDPRMGEDYDETVPARASALIYGSPADWRLLGRLMKERVINPQVVNMLLGAALGIEFEANRALDAGEPAQALRAILDAQQCIGLALGILTAGDPEELKRMGVLAASAPGRAAATAKRRADGKAKEERIRQLAIKLPRHWAKQRAAAEIAAQLKGISEVTVKDYLKRLFPGPAWKERSE